MGLRKIITDKRLEKKGEVRYGTEEAIGFYTNQQPEKPAYGQYTPPVHVSRKDCKICGGQCSGPWNEV